MTERDVVGDTTNDARRPAAVVVGAVLGILGALASFIPGLFWLAWVLGAIAIVAALPAFRKGPAESTYGMARISVFAGALAVVVGVLNLGITLDWFTFFTTDADALPPQ